ncbi:cytochrome c oxidase assembly protein [Dietzia psychralcaliphila]|uniref:cytochrome c oxidase assembly protein n=1 Tax=Dietzia TaxID=37914 RepID=UPI001FD090CE|nr:cytochrome c oxidase assembly protein [Dietzia psychralcaliphila]
MPHDHAQSGPHDWSVPEALGVLLLAVALTAYLVGVRRHSTRGSWPRYRTTLWIAGLICLGAAWIGPLASAAHSGFTAHMGVHLLLGMLGPLLLVLAAPVTLALRTLPPRNARAVSRVLRSPPVRVLTHPVVAAVLNAGGLWVLYTTDLFALMHAAPTVHVLVHAHVFLAGLVFTAAMIGPDPNPHRASFRTRAVVLVLFIAAHSILGRWLYGHPPIGVDPEDARAGAQLMFYGGEVIDLALLVLLFTGWYPGSRARSRFLPRNPSRPSRNPSRPSRDTLADRASDPRGRELSPP